MADKQFFSAATEALAVIEAAARFGLPPAELAYRTRSGQLRPGRVVIEVDPAAPRRAAPVPVEAGAPRPERLAKSTRVPAAAPAGGPGAPERVRRERPEPARREEGGGETAAWTTSDLALPAERSERARVAAAAVVQLAGLEVRATVGVAPGDGALRVDLDGPAREALVASGGELLHACEYLLRRMVRALPEDGMVVDSGGFREEREQELREQAARAARAVRESGEPYEFAPLPAAERRLVHLHIQDEPGVTSASEGEGELRRVRVLPG